MSDAQDVFAVTKLQDEKNLEYIDSALKSGRIDVATHQYLTNLYTDSMSRFRDMFLCLGKCFGAPKAAVHAYDYETDSAINKPITISDINPLEPYLVNHRLDEDPMRNQFFVSTKGHQIDLAVSSIVTVIVGAQKSVSRAIDKVTGKYYDAYINEVAKATHDIIAKTEFSAYAQSVSDKIYDTFQKNFISDAAPAVLGIIDFENQELATEIVRTLDNIKSPYARLRDVWRVKCLFDLVPQARVFIERICKMWPDKIIAVRDKFFDITNPRGYRDAKLVLNIGDKDTIIPMEFICQVRTFFEYEHETHGVYEQARCNDNKKKKITDSIENKTEVLHVEGVKKYNAMICGYVEDLFNRIGWNILYSDGNEDKLFEGFPRISTIYCPQKITDIIMEKVDRAVENELLYVQDAPVKLTKDQEVRIFRWMARFILVTVMPYSYNNWSVPTHTMAGKFFNFIMKELQRYYKK